MQTVFFVFVVATVILATKSLYIDRKCTEAGLVCKDCNTIKLCTRNGTKYQEEEIGHCGKSKSCFNGQCTAGTHPICEEGYDRFYCSTVGYFPDPYNCQMYHSCIEHGGHVIEHCKDGYSYNTRTEKCDLLLPKNQCSTTPVPLCTTIGQHGTVGGDATIYFICKSDGYYLAPRLYKCSSNQIYDNNYGCI